MSTEEGTDPRDPQLDRPPDTEGKKPRPITGFGGQTDRTPTQGVRKRLYEHGVNVGPSVKEIIEVERRGCIECREQLRRARGSLCVGFFSNRGGDGKSVNSTMFLQMFHDINPVMDRMVLIDVNTSMTTLDELNGLTKEDFLEGKYWTMESLYDYIMEQGGDIAEFDDLNAKLAYRTDPQLPIIPLQLEPTEFESQETELDPDDDEFVHQENSFTGQQYLVVLRVLKKFFTVIIHDFGTETRSSLTRTAFTQLHMLGVLTHSGKATTKMVGKTLEMLRMNYTGLLLNTVVIFNMTSQPSKQALRAIAEEKAGRTPNYRKLVDKVTLGDKEPKEIQTPGQALDVINGITKIRKVVAPLTLGEIILIGFDPHLKSESELRFSDVSLAVQAQLWTAMHTMLRTRAENEAQFLGLVEEGAVIRREQMQIKLTDDNAVQYRLSSPAERRMEMPSHAS